MRSIQEFTLEELKNWLDESGEKKFHASQIFNWLYDKAALSFHEMTNLSKKLCQLLEENFTLNSLELVTKEVSKDQETEKFLWKLSDDKLVESVLIKSFDRRTVCVSSQVGCPARCAFCASGKEGLFRNLSRYEIFEQVQRIDQHLKRNEDAKVTHIVFMGMGEPLANYEEVMGAIDLLIDENRLGLSERKITVSTVGLVEEIKKLAEEKRQLSLVLSLHAPNQHIRKKIIPYARKYPLEDILSAMLFFAKITKRDITYEYTLLAGINDSKEHAEELAQLIHDHPCTVNLIPYNPVEGLNLKRPEGETIEEFRDILKKRGLRVTWRYTKGKDIAAACGQLALKKNNKLSIAPSC